MLRKNACVIRKIVIHDTDAIRSDPDLGISGAQIDLIIERRDE